MTSVDPVSRNDLNQRRKTLRQKRRTRFFQSSWRKVAVVSLAATTLWVATLPAWVIRKPEQVTIEGNQFLSEQTIRTLLPIAYPQSLLKIQPQPIAEALKTKPAIANASVDRQLFPPGLVVKIQERIPVAVAAGSTADASQAKLLDAEGKLIPLETYTALNQNFKPPSLRVMGNPERYRASWSGLYSDISRSPVKVLEVNWENLGNLILKTELGSVHFGAYGANFPQQLRVLDQMRRLPTRMNLNQISYIDLRNPSSPRLQMNSVQTPVKLSTP
jgi:cell division protein FtsQ